MSIAEYEPDRDYSDETRYEQHRDRLATGLCSNCREDEALPEDELCGYCAAELSDEDDEA